MVTVFDEIMAHWKKGEPVNIPIEKFNPLIFGRRLLKGVFKKITTILEENAYSGNYLLLGEEGGGKTQILYFLTWYLKKIPEIDTIYLDLSKNNVEEKLKNLENVKKAIILLVDNIDDMFLRDPRFIINTLKALIRAPMTIVLALREETLNFLSQIDLELYDKLKEFQKLARLTFSRDDLRRFIRDISEYMLEFLPYNWEDKKFCYKYLRDVLISKLEINHIKSPRDIVYILSNEIDFINENLNFPIIHERKVSRSYKLIVKELIRDIINHFTNKQIEVPLGRFKLIIKILSINEKIRENGRSLFFNASIQLNNIKLTNVLTVNIIEAEKFDFEFRKTCEKNVYFILIYKRGLELIDRYTIYQNVSFLAIRVLAYLPFFSITGRRDILLYKFGLEKGILDKINSSSFLSIMKYYNKLIKSKISEEIIRESLYPLVLSIICEFRKDVKLDIHYAFEMFKCNIQTLFKGVKTLGEDAINMFFESLLSTLVRENLVLKGEQYIFLIKSFEDLIDILDKAVSDIMFRIKFYLL